ncbi:MAG: ADP-forming succinate--CoA ligase subunit beta, partial [Candidatus Binatia bacterium]|nr:ADP-forming succinate--CoA ligase subunit beta [Candidatus Binatia bacterium]
MNIHEYQAKEILVRFGVPVPQGKVACTSEEAKAIAQELGTPCVVKAQIHAGGRGKAGGVKVVKSPEEAGAYAREIIGQNLVTHQTGPSGRKVGRVLVEQGVDIARELYLGVLLDTSSSRPSIIACAEGGVEIEEVAKKNSEKILREEIDPAIGLLPFQIRRLAAGLGLPRGKESLLDPFLQGIVRAYLDSDCMLVEINPLVWTGNGKLLALDVKMNFDANALYRRKEITALRDTEEEDPKEVQASNFGLSYIALEGNIGCMVNGAGLAMATMDIIKLYGGEPANFLDVGGGATTEQVTEAFKIMLKNPNLEAILVNIFGGIMRCDV